MSILTGLLLINGTDIYEEFGTFLAETAQDEHKNYDELLKMPALKKQPEVSIREEDGVRTAQSLVQTFEARDITLRFALEAADDAAFLRRYCSLRPVSENRRRGLARHPPHGPRHGFPCLSQERRQLLAAHALRQRTRGCAVRGVVLREPRPTFKPVQTTL